MLYHPWMMLIQPPKASLPEKLRQLGSLHHLEQPLQEAVRDVRVDLPEVQESSSVWGAIRQEQER